MQVQKEEVRDAIIEKATIEFVNQGFEKASIRKIVKEAGTTIGNFYNYFKSKEEVFYTITTPVYQNFIELIKNHKEDEVAKKYSQLPMNEEVLRHGLTEVLRKYSKAFDIALVILIDGSKGTKYENIKQELIEVLSMHFKEHLENDSKLFTGSYNQYFAHAVAAGFLEGVLDILRSNYTTNEKKELVIEYILFLINSLFSY
ncbi:TetR/AcrR family transcriptional regulator [Brassicibacter mesophilus]|uniref:TetR/AcrR family transcriptional regulator n=1 Tax=Brassicibacter mesophilus TaxID=745119 RepID=UPI003D1CA54F